MSDLKKYIPSEGTQGRMDSLLLTAKEEALREADAFNGTNFLSNQEQTEFKAANYMTEESQPMDLQ